MLLNVKKSTPNNMVWGELGILPSNNIIICRILNYWFKVVSDKQDRIKKMLYKLMVELYKKKYLSSPMDCICKNIIKPVRIFRILVKPKLTVSKLFSKYCKTWN